MTKMGVNIDHVATIRQARLAKEPDPAVAAEIAESAGADGITVHLREDRRHINDRDVEILRRTVRTKLNLEMSINREIVDIACRIRPDQATLVPERRKELTTEGGLDVTKHYKEVEKAVKLLKEKKILVSIFINADKKQIKAAAKTGAEFIELHTGEYANAKTTKEAKKQLNKLAEGAQLAKEFGLRVNAGHGLNYVNTSGLLRKIPDLEELNIGHSIISRAVLVGLDKAVREMKKILYLDGKK